MEKARDAGEQENRQCRDTILSFCFDEKKKRWGCIAFFG
jgi:hypothetical protein